jgi:hypothetical protein
MVLQRLQSTNAPLNRAASALYRRFSSGGSQIDDPFRGGGGEPGMLQIYGTATSRVAKVSWAAGEVGLKMEFARYPPKQLANEEWYLKLNPKGGVL